YCCVPLVVTLPLSVAVLSTENWPTVTGPRLLVAAVMPSVRTPVCVVAPAMATLLPSSVVSAASTTSSYCCAPAVVTLPPSVVLPLAVSWPTVTAPRLEVAASMVSARVPDWVVLPLMSTLLPLSVASAASTTLAYCCAPPVVTSPASVAVPLTVSASPVTTARPVVPAAMVSARVPDCVVAPLTPTLVPASVVSAPIASEP